MLKRRPFGRDSLFALCFLFVQSPTTGIAQSTTTADVAGAKAEAAKGQSALEQAEYAQAVGFFRKAISLDPDSRAAHEGYYSATMYNSALGGSDNAPPTEKKARREAAIQELQTQYIEWAKEYPEKAVFPMHLSRLNLSRDYQKVEDFARQAVKLDAKCAEGYRLLSMVEDFRGDERKSSDYLRLASDADPKNPEYMFSYAMSLKNNNPVLWERMLIRTAEKFPTDDHGAQALYWLSKGLEKPERKIPILQKLITLYPPDESRWSADGVIELFTLIRPFNPQQALALAREMATQLPDDADWRARMNYQKVINDARILIYEKQYSDALALLGETKPPRGLDAGDLYLFKAEAVDAAGHKQKAYDELAEQVAKNPTDALRTALIRYGDKLGKKEKDVDADLWRVVNATAKPVLDFKLPRYGDEKKLALSDFRGKVVLLNFWYPSCGPCRTENPRLQETLTKIGVDKMVILAINVDLNEDALVTPYLKNKKFDFVALRGDDEFAQREFDVKLFPTNILIDQRGRSVARLGSIYNEQTARGLELQILLLLSLTYE
jgi:thiol-disulfide isomerase/thioredoxin